MSIEAFNRALNAKVGGGNRKVILLAYANHAHADGRNAFPAYATVAEYAEVDVRTVKRLVKSLVKDGWMRRGDQELVAHRRGDRRPVVYDIAMDDHTRELWAADDEAQSPADETAGDAARGDNLSPREESTDVENHAARRDDLSPRDDDHEVTAQVERGDKAVSPEPSGTIQEPPTPTAAPATTGSCPAHPGGRPNCRFCGTTPRQLAEAAQRAEDDRRRTEEQAAWRRQRDDAARARREAEQAAATNAEIARTAIAKAKARARATAARPS